MYAEGIGSITGQYGIPCASHKPECNALVSWATEFITQAYHPILLDAFNWVCVWADMIAKNATILGSVVNLSYYLTERYITIDAAVSLLQPPLHTLSLTYPSAWSDSLHLPLLHTVVASALTQFSLQEVDACIFPKSPNIREVTIECYL